MENLYLAAGSPDRVLLVGFKSEKLKPLTGKTLAEVAKMRGKDPIETIMDLIVEDRSRVGTVYFLMAEENLKKELRQPWVSLGSDGASLLPKDLLKSPRSTRLRKLRTLPIHNICGGKGDLANEAVRRPDRLPSQNLASTARFFSTPD